MRLLLLTLLLPLAALAAEAIAAFRERARLVRDAMKAKDYRVKELQVGGRGCPGDRARNLAHPYHRVRNHPTAIMRG